MAYFAEIDGNNIVLRVVVIDDAEEADEENFCANLFKTQAPTYWKQTSYNTQGGVHHDPVTHQPDSGVALRKNYASPGHTYDSGRDAFIAPKDRESFIFDEDKCEWMPPIAYPDDGLWYYWDEPTVSWKLPE